MRFSIFQLSRQGGRPMNEDRMGYCYTSASGLFVVADGMGGHPKGEVAAQIAVNTLTALFKREARPRVHSVRAFLGAALMSAHHQIIRYASENAMLDTPRTTLVGAIVQDDEVIWMHCGDSRLYVVRDGALLVRTRDHSFAEMEHGRLGRANHRVNRNVLFTCLGSTVRPTFDVSTPMRLRHGDKVMLCSDGLWGTVDDAAIVQALSSQSVDKAVPNLVEQALKNGGTHADNVTVVALEWEAQEADSGFDETLVARTEMLEDGEFMSTIQAGEDPDLDELDEEAIERSIAEINDAIRRSGPRKS